MPVWGKFKFYFLELAGITPSPQYVWSTVGWIHECRIRTYGGSTIYYLLKINVLWTLLSAEFNWNHLTSLSLIEYFIWRRLIISPLVSCPCKFENWGLEPLCNYVTANLLSLRLVAVNCCCLVAKSYPSLLQPHEL